jgi:hypothetical protein
MGLEGATLLPVIGDTWGPRAVRNWFEALPFHRGMSLLGIAVLVPAVVIGGTVLLGGESTHTATRPPATPHAVAAPPHTWGAYVPPRKVVPTPARTQRGSLILLRPTPPIAKPKPSPSTNCPAEWRQWRWLWEMCRRNTSH